MRLTALLLMVLAVTDAKNMAMPDLSGIWIADIARCNFGTSPRPNWLTLNVTRNGDRLSVIEVARDNGEIHLAERQYVLKSGVRPVGNEVGSAKIAGRMTVLQFSGQLDRWRISEDGSELIVNRSRGNANPIRQRTLIFRRSSKVVE